VDPKVESKSVSHFYAIDILRGLAALSVCIFHFTGSTDLANTVASWGKYGHLGVEIFFVISGFIIPYSMQKSNYKLSSFFRFIVKRMARINPPYIVIILATLLYIYCTRRAFMPTLDSILPHFIYMQTFLGYESLSPVFWTLVIEFQFYIFIGLFFYLISNQSIILFAAFIELLLLAFLCYHGGNLLGYLSFFILGILLFRSKFFKIHPTLYWALVSQCILLTTYKIGLAQSIAGLFAFIVIAYVKVNIRFIGIRLLIASGTISYSLYLIHWEFGRALVALSKHIPIVQNHELLRILFALCGTILGSIIFYRLLEKPSIKLSTLVKT